MILLLSPAKKMDYESELPVKTTATQPQFLDQSEVLIKKLRNLSRKKIGQLMHLSANLAELNYNRYQNWERPFTTTNARPAIYAFRGDVYLGLDADTLTPADLEFAQEHLRILSGLHGFLRPLDLVQPHRLEMGTRLPVRRKKNLYEYWKKDIAAALGEALEKDGSGVIVNLASQEYFKAVDDKKLKARVITCHFSEFRDGEYKAIMLFVKQARGSLARYAIDHRLTSPEDLKGFDRDGYSFNEPLSSTNDWYFTR